MSTRDEDYEITVFPRSPPMGSSGKRFGTG
jgi:hypothetical protein